LCSLQQSDSLECHLVTIKISPKSRYVSTYGFVYQLLDCSLMLRNTAAASVFVEGDGSSGFSKQFMVEVSTFFGRPLGLPEMPFGN
jgi:hypothetical protein